MRLALRAIGGSVGRSGRSDGAGMCLFGRPQLADIMPTIATGQREFG